MGVLMMNRENPCAAEPPLMGHTSVPWVPGMWNGDEGRQTMKVTDCRMQFRELQHCVENRENPCAAEPPLMGHGLNCYAGRGCAA